MVRPKIILFGDSITEQSFGDGGWGASLANLFSRKVFFPPILTLEMKMEGFLDSMFYFMEIETSKDSNIWVCYFSLSDIYDCAFLFFCFLFLLFLGGCGPSRVQRLQQSMGASGEGEGVRVGWS